MMDGSPRLAAMQASRSLASSSRTWFSTGINKTGFFDVMAPVVLLSHFYSKGLNRIRMVSNEYLPQEPAALQAQYKDEHPPAMHSAMKWWNTGYGSGK
jgi:hypothetical protein